jgi:DNA-binding MarR family transcriptional regulator
VSAQLLGYGYHVATGAWLDEKEQRAWRAFLTASRLLLDRLDRELQRDAGMPHAYYEILVVLSEAPGRSMRMTDVAARLYSSRSRLSHAVARLEELGWVERAACPSDGRGTLAVLTDAGYRALRSAAPGHVTGVRAHLFDQLSDTQVAQLTRISDAVGAHLLEVDAAEGDAEANAGLRPVLRPSATK